MSIVIFLLVLFVLVLVHEWGHFITAKKTGMRVDEFGIGFPPKLFGIKKNGTEYTFNALPIGGFVKIWGENGEEPISSDVAPENTDQLIIGEDIASGRSFVDSPRWAQALVLVAGVAMNIIFAWFLFSITYMIGVPTAVDEATAGEDAQLYVANVLPDSPASVLPIGSVITSVSYGEIEITDPTPSAFTIAVTTAAPEAVVVDYIYQEEQSSVTLTPQVGLNPDQPDQAIVGASLSLIETQSMSLGASMVAAARSTWAGLTGIITGLWMLLSESIMGEADFSQIAGPVGIVSLVGDAAAFGLTALLTFTAIISLNLAVINLLPFPALDGGRLVFVIIEAITGKPIPAVWSGRINLIGFAILMLLMIAVTVNDVTKLL